MYSQIEMSLHQDGRLLVLGDDHGNDPGTIDVLFTTRFYNGGNRRYNWTHEIFVYVPIEFADLDDGDYWRYAMGVGYEFKVSKRISVLPSFDYGATTRWNATAFSYNGLLELGYNLTPKLRLGVLGAITQRPDLYYKWETTTPTYSLYFGLTYMVAK